MALIEGVDENGGKRQVGVQKDRLKVRAVNTDEILFAVQEGRGFQVYTTVLSLTDAVKKIMFFIENNDVEPILITSATIGSNQSLNGVDNSVLIEQAGNISPADDIVTAGDDLLVTNRKSGDPRKFIGVVKGGPQALSSNEVFATGTLADVSPGRTFNLSTEIPVGGSAAISIQAPTANTGINLTLTISFHLINGV